MAFNLIEAVGSQFMQKGLMSKISSSLGEDSQATTKALPGAIAAIAAGVADQGGNEAGAHRLLSKLNEGGFTGPDAPPHAGGFGEGLMDEEERGKGMLSGLFGNKLGGITEALSRFGGMRNSGSSMRLLSLAAPMLMGVLGKQVRDQRMGASGLMQLLSGQRSNIAAALPAGLGSILGFGGGARHAVAEVIEPHRETVSNVRETLPTRDTTVVREPVRQTVTRPPAPKKSIAGWAVPLALLALVALAWGALRGRRHEPARAPQVSRTTPPQPRVDNRVAQAPQPVRPTPPPAPVVTPPPEPATPPATGGSGTGGSGMEKLRVNDASGLREAFNGPNATQGFVLDGVEFQTGSARLTAKGEKMVDELGGLMKEKDGSRVSITGYTDSTGSADVNQRLSQERANSVRSSLVRDGIAEDRIEASGEGAANPIASNDTPQGRVQNRRIEVKVLGQ
jgi:OmpA-OmpF porin, OOP family